jgi:hypothetical protein
MQYLFPVQDPTSAAAMGLIPAEFDIESFYNSQDNRSKMSSDNKIVPPGVQAVRNWCAPPLK